MIRSNSFSAINTFSLRKWALLPVFALLFVACSTPAEENTAEVESLEQRYQELLDKPAEGKKMDEVWATMKELAAAYNKRGKDNADEGAGIEDLYRAAELYSAAFEYGEALRIYDEIIEKHGSHKRAADALFAKGFIFNDKIGDTAQARSAYESFLRQYPDHQMAEAARKEIELLGVPAEEWLKRIKAGEDSAVEKNMP